MSCCLLVVLRENKTFSGQVSGGVRLVAMADFCSTILIIELATVTLSILSLLMVLLMVILTAK